MKNHERIIGRKMIYSNKRYKTDFNSRFSCRTRSGIRKALQGKIESSFTKVILGRDINLYKKL